MPTKKTTTKKEVVKESKEKVAFRNLIEAYKEQNSAKYELKKESLEAQLNSLK